MTNHIYGSFDLLCIYAHKNMATCTQPFHSRVRETWQCLPAEGADK